VPRLTFLIIAIQFLYQYSNPTNKNITTRRIMPPMASSIHPDFRDDVTASEAHAVDKETERLLLQQPVVEKAGDLERYLQLAQEMLELRLRVYKPESPPIAGCW
jgi:hypothetical protein